MDETLSSGPEPTGRFRLSLVELMVIVGLVGLLTALLWPWILSTREVSRVHACRNNLRQLGEAVHAYHDLNGHFPAAAIWHANAMDSLALHRSRRVDLFTGANWVQAVLPFAGQTKIAEQFQSGSVVAAMENQAARNTRLPLMICPSDPFNRPENPYRLEPTARDSITFARGNYAINGGSHCFNDGPGSTAFITGDAAHLVMDRAKHQFQFWGNGVAGFNTSFSKEDFENGTASLVLLEEVRAGVHPLDPRGVWSLGQIGGSVTWAHGVNSDAYGPNNQEPRSDDLLHGDLLHKTVGAEYLQKHRMPCVHYIDVNFQATSRSVHHGGVNVLMADGNARFISDAIDPGLWHVLHSRETPSDLLHGDLDEIIESSFDLPEMPLDSGPRALEARPSSSTLVNSIGMRFRLIPAGEFEMALPDHGNSHDIPREAPPHPVRITNSFYLGVHEVTRAQFERVVADEAIIWNTALFPGNESTLPATGITWHQAAAFCEQLSANPQEKAAGRRYRIPTEAEWEYACRAGDRAPYNWSVTRRPDDQSGDAAGINPPLPLQVVGSFPANAFGLHDMRGNAWEWCADWFDRDYYSRSPVADPRGPVRGYIKVVRGSSWTFVGEGCKLSYPMLPPWKSSPFVGFRVVCEAHPPSEQVASRDSPP